MDHAITRAAPPDARGFDEAEDATGQARGLPEPDQMGLRCLEVALATGKGESQNPCVEVEATLAVACDSGDVVYAV